MQQIPMKAKYRGVCKQCGGMVRAGTNVWYYPEIKRIAHQRQCSPAHQEYEGKANAQ